jgi:hypothetical protein
MQTQFCLVRAFNRRGDALRSNCIRIAYLAAVLGAVVAGAYAQDLVSLDKAYHPGEQVHVIFTFAGPVDISNGGVTFSLDKLENEAQRLWTRGFSFTQPKRLMPEQYEATGTIPDYAASGVYRLTNAWSAVADLNKSYGYPDTLHQSITIRVLNEKRDPLPALIDLKLVK